MKNAHEIKATLNYLSSKESVTLKNLERLHFVVSTKNREFELELTDQVILTIWMPFNEKDPNARDSAIDEAYDFLRGTRFRREDDNIVGSELMIVFSAPYSIRTVADLKLLVEEEFNFMKALQAIS